MCTYVFVCKMKRGREEDQYRHLILMKITFIDHDFFFSRNIEHLFSIHSDDEQFYFPWIDDTKQHAHTHTQ